MRLWRWAAMLAILTAELSSAGITASESVVSAGCRADRVQNIVRRVRSEALAQRARRRAGAATVRFLSPGQVVTMEYRADRLNLALDIRGRVARVSCG